MYTRIQGASVPAEARMLVTVDEAASMLSIGRTFIYHLLRSGELRGVKVGRTRRVVVASLHDYVGRLLGQAG